MSLLLELVEEEFLERFLYEIETEELIYEMKDMIMYKLQSLGILVYIEEISIDLNGGVNINISQLLEDRLVIFEENNPEYFI